MDYNKCFILGNVSRGPELRSTATGTSVCTFGVATGTSWSSPTGESKSKVEYHDIVAWGKLGETLNSLIGVGSRVFVEGSLQTRSWEMPDGQKRSRTEIIASNVIKCN